MRRRAGYQFECGCDNPDLKWSRCPVCPDPATALTDLGKDLARAVSNPLVLAELVDAAEAAWRQCRGSGLNSAQYKALNLLWEKAQAGNRYLDLLGKKS